MGTDKYLGLATIFAAIVLYGLIESDVKPPRLSGPLVASGMYVQESGYLLILRPSLKYELCNETACISGIWKTASLRHGAYEAAYVVSEVHPVVTLENLFKVKLGLQFEIDTAFDQHAKQRAPENVADFAQSEEFLKNVIGYRMHQQTGYQYDLIAGVDYTSSSKDYISLLYGPYDMESFNGIPKYGSF